MNGSGRSMYVFRDGDRSIPGSTLVEGLAARLQRVASLQPGAETQHSDVLLDALLRAGELECGLSDAGSPEASRLSRLTDCLARQLVGSESPLPGVQQLLSLLPGEAPSVLRLTPPEGFAYYALHPRDFADIAASLELHTPHAAVIGIRSIGTTLSAVVVATLLKRGIRADRVTVRPHGHPYDRSTQFGADAAQWLAGKRAQDADFLVSDEGPGMSGSSFLSVGEALVDAGVDPSRVQFLCSRQADIGNLCARDAASRWSRFRWTAAHAAIHLPAEARIYIGGGYWRNELVGPDPAGWPASWSQMERMKFLSPDRRTFFKFAGFGRFGEEILGRAQVLSEGGYAPAPSPAGDGFLCQSFVEGAILTPGSLSCEVLDRMAGYCAMRQAAFPSQAAPNAEQLETMLRFNLSEEFGGMELDPELARLHSDRPVVVDGRMLPQEWVRADDGWLMKCDGASHGDDHFFPGPATDMAWDLAGAIVEWELDADASGYFLDRYRLASGDDARRRLPPFLLAYAVFRLGQCKMGAEAMKGSTEEPRLLAAYRRYRECAASMLPQGELLAAD